MTTATFRFPLPFAHDLPRGASLFSWLSARTAAVVPQARKLTRAEEAAPVRELAWRVRQTDPGFSADLYAAAARHESLDD
jgi:hypothetical protein